MILLSEHSLTRARKIPLEAMSLQLKERESTASMTPADMEGIGTGSWFLDDTEPGAGIVWRVQSIRTAWATDTPTVQLEHVINTLRDRILFGEVTPATITGSASAATCTARQAVEYILRHQSDWRLGSFDYGSVSNAYKFDGDTLFDALETVTGTLDDAWWSYDMTVYPFRLNITRKSSAVGSELRCGRNLRTIQRTIDTNGMYTRFYPIGYDDLHLASLYRERNTAAYGVIEHTETDTSRTTEAELASWANEKLSRHAEPLVNIEVEGLELVQATGESLDRMTLGRMCRVPLSEFGTTITERIVSLTYQDKVHQPEVVRITLANNRDDVVRIIADNMKSAGRGGRAATRLSKNDHAWFEDTDDHVAMCAEGIVGVDAEGNPNWILLSELIVDGTGIHQTVKSIQADQVLAWTAIEQNEESITLEAQRASEAEGELSGRIQVAADAIELEVENRTNADEALSSSIKMTATNIMLAVESGQSALYSSVIEVTSTSISLAVAGGQSELYSSVIEVTSTNISLAVASGQSALYSSVIEVTSTSISLAVAEGQSAVYSSVIAVTSTSISLKVGKGEVISSINQTAEQITIQANRVNLSGYVTADDITAQFISGVLANTNVLSTAYMYTDSFEIGSGTITINEYQCDLEDAIWALQIAQTGNVSYLQRKRFTDDQWITVGPFNTATTLSGEWSGTVAAGKSYKVTATPQGNIQYSPAMDGLTVRNDKTWAQDYRSFTQTFYVYDENGTDLYEENLMIDTGAAVDHGGGGDIGNAGARFGAASGSTYIQAYNKTTSEAISGTDVAYSLGYNLSNTCVEILDYQGNKIANTDTFPIWIGTASSQVHHQGTLALDTLYGLMSGNTVLATWKTAAAQHAPSIKNVWTTDRTLSGWNQLNSLKTQYENAKADSEYFCISVDCYGEEEVYYCAP